MSGGPWVPPEHLERVSLLLEHMRDGLAIIEDGRLVFVNDQACAILGRSREELQHLDGVQLAAPEEQPRLREIIEEAQRTGDAPDELEFWIEHPDGRRCINNRYAYARRDDGTVCRYVLVTDVTERRRSQEALAENERFLNEIFASIQDGISIVDTELRILRTNSTSERWHPHAMPLVGKHCYAAYHGRSEPCEVCPTRHTLATGEEAVEVVRLPDWGGEAPDWIELYSFPMFDRATGKLKGVIEYARDITAQKREEEQHAALAAQLREARRIEGIGRLAAGVAHDLNNLLTPIIGGTDMALMDLGAGDPRREDLVPVLTAAEHARELVARLLAFGRRQVLRVEPVALNTLVAEVRGMLGRLLREDISIEVYLDPELSPVRADRSQLVQVLINLCVNAGDFMPDGGTLSIETADAFLDEDYCGEHTEVTPGPYVMLSVSDDGLGMDQETLGRIFEPFFTTKTKGLGSGLGLATVHGIVKQHDGHIWVYSEPRQGTTIKVYLPASAETDQEPAPKKEPAVLRRFAGETVLVAEDNVVVRDFVVRLLERQGLTVLAAASGENALTTAAEHRGSIHLLLTDVILPGMNGRELFEQLVATRPDLRVLYMSGYTDNVIARRGVITEGTCFLQKPFTLGQLVEAVCAALESQGPATGRGR